MKKSINFKYLILILLLMLMLILIIFNNLNYRNRCLADNYIDNTYIEEIKNTHQEYTDKIDLYFDGKIIPYSNYDNFYLLYIRNSTDYKKIYTNSDFKIRIIEIDDYIINLFAYNDKYYKEIKVEMTNTPIISIDYNNNINLYGFNVNIYNLKCEYAIRGDLSQNSDKKSYKLSLKNQQGKKINLPLLNMKSDNVWILNSIYLDNSYMREKIGYDLWNKLSPDFNHNLEYVELIINNEYQGLYYLQERVTMETFNGNKKQDMLVSIKKWDTALNALGHDNSVMTDDSIFKEFEVDEGLDNNYQKQMRLLKSYRASILDDKTQYVLKYDLDNMINYKLFLNFTMARDNTYKNQKMIFKDMKSYYLIQKTPWDLDWIFNNEKVYLYNSNLNADLEDIDIDLAVPETIRNNEQYIKLSKNKYYEFKEKYFNENNISKIIDNYLNYLESNGAINRDINKWGNKNYLESIDVIKEFVVERTKILDKYYGGL